MFSMPEAESAAESLIDRIRPLLVEKLKQGRPSSFDDIEATGASVGDLLARLLMQSQLGAEEALDAAALAALREEALRQAPPDKAQGRRAEDLVVHRIRGKPKTIKTIRGEVRFERDYYYFPELGIGLFPPRQTSEDRQ